MRIARGNKGETFFHFLLNSEQTRTDCIGMGKQTISTAFIVLSLGDVIVLSQLSLSLWEALAFGALCTISYGLGIFSGLAE